MHFASLVTHRADHRIPLSVITRRRPGPGDPQLRALFPGRADVGHDARVVHTPRGGEPLDVRMMTDDVSGIGLWDQSVTYEEEELPLPDDARAKLRAWVDEP